jgi:acetyl esterase/lipase
VAVGDVDESAVLRSQGEHHSALAAALGVDTSRLAVGGGSAGANLSAAVALMARDRHGPALRAQVLQVPVTGSSCNSASMRVFAKGYVMSRQNAKDM